MICSKPWKIRYLGNRDPNLFFALLTTFAMRTSKHCRRRGLADPRTRFSAGAHETYIDDRPCIFYLFHRPRVWNLFDRLWMGYERKRGKLEQFNARLRGGAQTAFFQLSSAISLFSLRSSTSSPWIPTRNCHAMRRVPWSATLPTRSIGRSTMPARTHCRRLRDPATPRFDQHDAVLASHALPNCLRVTQGWTLTRARFRMFTRIFSGKVRSSARASTT